jgi:hypothetical protein
MGAPTRRGMDSLVSPVALPLRRLRLRPLWASAAPKAEIGETWRMLSPWPPAPYRDCHRPARQLKEVKAEEGMPAFEQIRRAIRDWLGKKSVMKPAPKAGSSPPQRV